MVVHHHTCGCNADCVLTISVGRMTKRFRQHVATSSLVTRHRCSRNFSFIYLVYWEATYVETSNSMTSAHEMDDHSAWKIQSCLCSFQRASALIGSFKAKIGGSRSSSGETFFWTRPTDFCQTTNSRYSVRYIRLYVNCTPTYITTASSVH